MNLPTIAQRAGRPAPAPGTSDAAAASALERLHEPYFVQKLRVGRELIGRPRVEVLREICRGRRVLHVGCVDWPITDLESSLHLQLEDACAHLDGFDVHTEAFAALQPHLRGRLFGDWAEVTGAYDLLLVPEALEHVGDVPAFLRQLDAVRAPNVVITVPDAYQCMRRHFDYVPETETFVEVVHPDHNCWYTPYTLASVLRKYTDWTLDGMWFFNRMSLLAMLSKPQAAGASRGGGV